MVGDLVGTSCSFTVTITRELVASYADLSGDRNPVHLDAEYASRTEFGGPIAHGTLLLGLVSRVLGEHLPGRRCVIMSLKSQFPKPMLYPGEALVQGTIRSFSPAHNAGVTHVTVTDRRRGWMLVDATVHFTLHRPVEEGGGADHVPRATDGAGAAPYSAVVGSASRAHGTTAPSGAIPHLGNGTGRPLLLVTGGTGGIGSTVLPLLTELYDLCCLTRRALDSLADMPACRYIQVDLEDEESLERVLADLNPGAYYGILHLSAPGMTRSFISEDLEMVRRQIHHAVEVPLMLARWAKGEGSAIKRMLLIGSTAGAKYAKPRMGAYSLAKAATDHLVRLLAAELGPCGMTVNAIVPTALAVGINQGMPDRAQLALQAKMPTGRLVDGSDIVNLVKFLLSPLSSQINGSSLLVDGGLTE